MQRETNRGGGEKKNERQRMPNMIDRTMKLLRQSGERGKNGES